MALCFVGARRLTVICLLGGRQHVRQEKRPHSGDLNESQRNHPKGKVNMKGGQKGRRARKGTDKGQKGGGKGKSKGKNVSTLATTIAGHCR